MQQSVIFVLATWPSDVVAISAGVCSIRDENWVELSKMIALQPVRVFRRVWGVGRTY